MKVSVAKRPRHVKRKRNIKMGKMNNDAEWEGRGEAKGKWSMSKNPEGRGRRGGARRYMPK